MNWLKKVAQMPDPADIIMGVIENRYDGSAPSLTQPAGGGAYKEFMKFRELGPPPEVCQMINELAGLNPAARPKMQILAKAAGCQWVPENPPNADQPQPTEMNAVMPMMGQQERPMDVPSMEIE